MLVVITLIQKDIFFAHKYAWNRVDISEGHSDLTLRCSGASVDRASACRSRFVVSLAFRSSGGCDALVLDGGNSSPLLLSVALVFLLIEESFSFVPIQQSHLIWVASLIALQEHC